MIRYSVVVPSKLVRMGAKYHCFSHEIVTNEMIHTRMKTVTENPTCVGIIIISSFLLFYIPRNQHEICLVCCCLFYIARNHYKICSYDLFKPNMTLIEGMAVPLFHDPSISPCYQFLMIRCQAMAELRIILFVEGVA